MRLIAPGLACALLTGCSGDGVTRPPAALPAAGRGAGGNVHLVHAGVPGASGVPLTTTTTTTTTVAALGDAGWSMGPVDAPVLARQVGDLPRSPFGPADKVVALTFDDGPDPRFTPEVLSVLARYRAPASFFMVGREANRFPDLVRQVAAGGDSVEGHTWDHVDLTRLSDGGFAGEVDRTDDLLGTLTGRPVRCVRPPKGRVDGRVVRLLGERHLATMMWSLDPRDWRKPGRDAISGYVLAGLRPGAVILLHDGGGDRGQTVDALPVILDGLHARGYRVVPLCQ
jgi:peptidoglycan/xylan/chitin deacetylase (PgdA/CDA1 family)